jgi:hypothetical protein
LEGFTDKAIPLDEKPRLYVPNDAAVHGAKWNEVYDKLTTFALENDYSDVLLSSCNKQNVPLGAWVARQREREES